MDTARSELEWATRSPERVDGDFLEAVEDWLGNLRRQMKYEQALRAQLGLPLDS